MLADFAPGGVIEALIEQGSALPVLLVEMKMEDRTKVISAFLVKEKFLLSLSLHLSKCSWVMN